MTELPKIYCALDTTDLDFIEHIAQQVTPLNIGIKLGMTVFNAHGPQGVARVRETHPNVSIFLDLKFHDIPMQVAGAVTSVANLGVDYINVHAQGGYDMMHAAQEALDKLNDAPRLIAVTVLTSLNQEALNQTGHEASPKDLALRLAKLTKDAGLSGIVCSAHEIETIKNACGADFKTMVPGIRPAGSDVGDQKRIMTPKQAMDAGADHLVIGRPITGADNPAQAAEDILAEMA